MKKYKLSEIEDTLDDWLRCCTAHDYLDLLKFCGIVSDDTTLADIDEER